ncbi:RIB43A-like with coiled-coils protein 1 [Dipodomys spectabilis]|uniref:RIB43A-like with coiled-coils protein 1 n=1 Tax=Dipodomys spectabilis TaxID=105255 RepID=UPI001C534FC4|nr:RIB43A-like with coiled-coils protein 1 [Dipodomys spectabilis]
MYKVDLSVDPKEVAAIIARRNRERERQSRIFNVRNRTIGVDVAALNQQVEERRLREAREQSKDVAYGTMQVQNDLVAQMIERQEAERTQQMAKKMLNFWEQKQQAEQHNYAHEFNLWNTSAPFELSACLKSNDRNRGQTNMQHSYFGDNMNRASCLRAHQEHLKNELDKQLQDQERIRAEEARVDMLSDQLRLAMDKQAAHMAKLEESYRVALMTATANANKAQATKIADRQHREQWYQQETNRMEIQNQVTSDMLTENPQVAQHPTNPNRVLPYCWKGMTPEQRAAIRKTQRIQSYEKEVQREAEKQLTNEWDNQRIHLAQAAQELEEQERELCAEFRRGLGSFNQQLASEQSTHQNHLNSMIYASQPTAQYYMQFNSSSR